MTSLKENTKEGLQHIKTENVNLYIKLTLTKNIWHTLFPLPRKNTVYLQTNRVTH